jgi:hypothetical protein
MGDPWRLTVSLRYERERERNTNQVSSFVCLRFFRESKAVQRTGELAQSGIILMPYQVASQKEAFP